jgi:excisionase family DNA binding protein
MIDTSYQRLDRERGDTAMSAMGNRPTKLTVKRAAERAGVSTALVYRWCDERRLPHYRAGGKGRRGKILIEPSDLDSFLESLKVETPEDPDEAVYRRHLR